MARGQMVVLFEEVEILDVWKSKKGTDCVKVGWNSKAGSGQQIFYGEEKLAGMEEGTIVTIKATPSGDFYRVDSADALGKVKAKTASAA